MQKFRKGVPENSSVYVCKNSLLKEAVKQVPGWETLADAGCTVSMDVVAAAWDLSRWVVSTHDCPWAVGRPDQAAGRFYSIPSCIRSWQPDSPHYRRVCLLPVTS
jgi:hypothetical protein